MAEQIERRHEADEVREHVDAIVDEMRELEIGSVLALLTALLAEAQVLRR